jgi:hypothetical protein
VHNCFDPLSCIADVVPIPATKYERKLFMKPILSLLLLVSGFYISACSKAVEENNAVGTLRPMPTQDDPANIWAQSRSNMPSRPIESSSPTSRDVVLFDGKNYIKKNGWKKPSKKDTYKDENYDQGDAERVTRSGKRVRTKTDLYLIRPPWLHSQDFIYKGQELDNLKGTLASFSFTEMSANGKVFLYSITVEKVVSPAPSNSSTPDHEDPFIYEIMDADGDGIFETLLRDYDELIVPIWVLN